MTDRVRPGACAATRGPDSTLQEGDDSGAEALQRAWTSFSVVVPAHDEAGNLGPLVEEIVLVMEGLGYPWELLVVDDGSTDDSATVLQELGRRFSSLRTLRLATNLGQSAALVAGFDAARGRWLITLDADLQNNPADIPRQIARLEEADVVCGVRRQRRDSWLRRLSSSLARHVRQAVLGDRITDVGCSIRVFPRHVARRLPRFDGMHRFLPILLEWEGCRVTEIDVDHRERHAGVSKYNVRNRLFRTLADLLAVRWMKSRRVRYEIDE